MYETLPADPAAVAVTGDLPTIVDVLRRRAAILGQKRAYVFLTDSGTEVSIDHAGLDRAARQVASALRSRAAEGDRVLLVYAAGVDYLCGFFGCLYAGFIAVPVSPPHSSGQLPRLESVARDAATNLVLTTGTTARNLRRRFHGAAIIDALDWIATDQLSVDADDQPAASAFDPESLAYLQYTSGSTGAPRGVTIRHRHVACNIASLDEACAPAEDSVIVTWLPHFHDMGLVYGLLMPLYVGCECVFMSPMTFIQRPIRWLSAISRYGGTHATAPNFAYDLCVRKCSAEQIARLDLSTWAVAGNGAEPVRWTTMEAFARRFEPCGFRARSFCPAFGLAEATLEVTAVDRFDDPRRVWVDAAALSAGRLVYVEHPSVATRAFVACGRPPAGMKVVIVDPSTHRRVPPDRTGEIWVAGPSVASGYWNRPAESERMFGAMVCDTGEGPFLRTGDIGFLRDGELFVTGRLKDVVIVAGRNYHAEDLEATVADCHPAVRPGCCTAFSVDSDRGEQLVIAAEIDRAWRRCASDTHPDRTFDPTSLIHAIRQMVAEQHGIMVSDVVLLPAGTIPRTSSGKVQRHRCRDAYILGELGNDAHALEGSA